MTRAADFAALVAVETDECVLWPGGVGRNGYGLLKVDGVTKTVHRLALEHRVGPAPAGREAAHSCRNRHCMNYRHLRWATRTENFADKKRDGTELFGSARPWAKLTERAVVTIRERAARGDVQTHIARDYGVSPAAICEIVSRKKWPHVA
jgi:hypothetical protein